MKRYLLGDRAANWLRASMGELSYGSTDGGRTAAVDERHLPPPFRVMFAQSQNDGEGAWLVWMSPDAIIIDGEQFDVTGNLEPADGEYERREETLMDRWYQMPDINVEESEQTIWCNIGFDTNETPTATFDDAPSSDSSCLMSFRVAVVTYDSENNFREVTQIVEGSQHLKSPGCFALRAVDWSAMPYMAYFANPYIRVGGKTCLTQLTSATIEGGGIVAVKMPANTATFSASSASIVQYANEAALYAAEADVTQYVMPLYKFVGGVPVCDFRTGVNAIMGEF